MMSNISILARKWLKRAMVVFFVAALMAGAATSASAVVNASIQPASGSAVRDGNLTVEIALAPSAGSEIIWGMDVYVTYDTNVFDVPTLTDHNLGSGWAVNDKNPSFAPGKVQFSKGTFTGPGYTCSSQVNLYQLVFPVKSNATLGSTTIQIDTSVNPYYIMDNSFGNITGSTASGSFTIGTDTTPPTVSSVSPANGATDQPVNVAVRATFAADQTGIDTSTLTSSTLLVSGSSSGSHATSPTYNAGTRTVTFGQAGDFTAGETVTCTVKGGASGVKDNAGNALASDYVWTFTVVDTGDTDPPEIQSTTPAQGATNVAVNQSVAITFDEAMNTSSVTISSSPNPGGWSAGTWSNGNQTVTYTHNNFANNTSYTITVTAAKDAAGNDLTGDNDFSFTTVDGGGNPPIITSIPASAEAGQTIVISGNNFQAYTFASVVRFGTTLANPTDWQNGSITVAVPTGIPTGDVTVTVENADGSDTDTITINDNKIYIDDFEGGAVGDFTSPAASSGYYVFQNVNDITPDNSTINAELKKTEAAHDGTYGAKVRYSYDGNDGSDWGGGWGAALANTLDLTDAEAIELYIQWDGSSNEVTVSLKDSDGTAYAATISNATLMSLNGYGKVTINMSDFAIDDAGSDATDNDTFEESEVVSYNIIYKTKDTTTAYHYFDTLVADLPGGEDWQGEVKISSVTPPAGPAGTKIMVEGEAFGDNQSLSSLMFENDSSGASYAAEIISWSNTQIEAIVPRLAAAGTYTIKVIKVAIVKGTTTAQESNPAAFKVTASGPSEGGIATIWPNPFNPVAEGVAAQDTKAANIAFNPGSASRIGIYVYDMTARLVQHRTVDMGSNDADVRALSWDGTQALWSGYDSSNNLVGDGMYFLRIVDEDSKRLIAKGKIMVIKK